MHDRLCLTARPFLPPDFGFPVPGMAAETAELWEPGRTLSVKFQGGTPPQVTAVILAMVELRKIANIEFKVVLDPAAPTDLRCSFEPGASWSLVGKDALLVPQSKATMNMGWDDDPARDLHELCHALGMVHEHQSPAADIPWDREAVYRDYGGPPNSWSRAQVDRQVFDRYDPALITDTEFDRESIMLYPIPASHVTDPSFAVGWNTELSARDREFLAREYPQAKGA